MLLLLAGVQFALISTPPPDPGGWQPRLEAAIRRAVSGNPELSAMEGRIDASRQRAAQADAFPDPELEVGIKDIPVSSPSLTRDNFTMEMVTARQSLPGRGKLATRRASAEAAAVNSEAQHTAHAVTIAADVADAFFGIAEIDRRMEILERSRERLKRTSASATERYRVGKGAQSDVLRANLEGTALEDRLLRLKSRRRELAARLNALQGLAARTPVPAIGPIEPLPSLPDPAAVGRQAEERSPAVAGGLAAVRRAEHELRLAGLERRPDWMVSTYYGRRERFEDLAGAFVSFNLPFAHPRRLEAKRAEMEAELSSARADLEAVRNQIRRDVETAAAELEQNVEQERLYRTSILPQAEINFRAAQESYAVGQIDFETYVRAALDLDTYESEIATRSAGIGRALAALQRASGLPLIPGTPGTGDIHAKN
ncbi:MAG: TolC family protein [Acidobacteriota bacterium]|nr:TolC family protein [Acidobacteriota bacterium]